MEVAGPARRLWALVKNLPHESACFYEWGFTRSEEFLATLLEAFTAVNFKKGIDVPRPKPPLPKGAEQNRPRPSNVYSIAEFVARHQNDIRQPPPKGGDDIGS